MAAAKKKNTAKKKSGRRAEPRVWVRDGSGRRPFMRGIMVHSLMARGVSFDDAYRAADRIAARVKGKGTVSRRQLAKLVSDQVGDDLAPLAGSEASLPAPIEVVGRGSSLPFSKGSLSQSLLAAALDPTDAFDVAREIEQALVSRGSTRVKRGELRRMAYQTLLERFGENPAKRYLAWREHQDPRRPIVILVGGTTGVGKTSIALEVATRLGIRRVLSTDSIRQVMRIMLSRDLAPALHHSSFDAHEHVQTQLGGAEAVIEGFMNQAQAVSVGVRGMLERAIEEGTSVVIDGVSIVPGLLDVEEFRDAAHIIFLTIARLDRDAFRTHFATRAHRQRRRGLNRYIDRLDEIGHIQDHLLEVADRHHVPIIDNVSVDGSVLLAIRHIVESLREPLESDSPELPLN